MDSIGILIGLTLAWLVFIVLKHTLSKPKIQNLPPGPTPLPLIGNLHQIGKHYHKSLAELAKTYGPIMRIKLGQLPAVIITSPEASRVVLQKQDADFSNRWVPKALTTMDHQEYSVVFSTVSPTWRNIRKAMHNTLFANSKLDATQPLRAKKVHELIECCREHSLRGEAVHIDVAAFITTINIMSNSIFSRDALSWDSSSKQEMRDVMWNIAVESGEPNLADFFPSFVWFDLQGIRKRLGIHFNSVLNIQGRYIDERIEEWKLKGGPQHNDGLDSVLTYIQQNPQEFNRTLMERMFLDLFIAGSDTSSSSLEWAMSELLKNPEAMKKAKEEVARVIGKGKVVDETEIDQLPYLQCIVKETLRLHPPVPTLIPRMVLEDNVDLCGYTIPEGTKVLVNVWALGRDPSLWDDPLTFKPERFWESSLDLRGQDYELLPFGYGRRICAGMLLARRVLPVMIGSLINSFDWKLDGGMSPEELNMDEKVGIALQKAQPLLAIPMPLSIDD